MVKFLIVVTYYGQVYDHFRYMIRFMIIVSWGAG